MANLSESAAGIGLLADPLRREIYRYICAQPRAVGRDKVASALAIPHHKAKFHLEKLEHEGLLESTFARPAGRSGPGAGRPTKFYRRTSTDIAVSLPGREYELAGQLLAAAIESSMRTGGSAIEALHQEAARKGQEWGREAVAIADPEARALELAEQTLAEHGYEPREKEGKVILANCPFHRLSDDHTEMICGMNLALIEGMVDEVDPGAVECRLEGADGRCCVVLSSST
jgi:predicted ArsR family transcriptional regulator